MIGVDKLRETKLQKIILFRRELLTPQQHYDWGLRALKTILRGCGSLLQNVKKNLKDGGNTPHIESLK